MLIRSKTTDRSKRHGMPVEAATRKARAKEPRDDPSSVAALEEPDSLKRALGHQLRMLRLEHDLSLADVAAASGIGTSMMSKIEKGQISPSLATLQALSQALNTPVTSLFAAYEEKRDCAYVPAGQGAVIERIGSKAGHVCELLGTTIDQDIIVEPYIVTLSDGAEPYTGFQHSGIEFLHMLTGQVVYRQGDSEFLLHPGDSLLFDSRALHGPSMLSKAPTTLLSVIVYSQPRRRCSGIDPA